MEFFRNKFVIHEESGHPGRREIAIYAEKEDLLSLAEEIIKQKNDEKIRLRQYASFEHGQSCRVELVILSKTEDEIDFYHTTPTPQIIKNCLRAVLGCIFFGLAVFGAWKLLS